MQQGPIVALSSNFSLNTFYQRSKSNVRPDISCQTKISTSKWIHLEVLSKVSSSSPKIYNSQLHIGVLYITIPICPLNVKDGETQLFRFGPLTTCSSRSIWCQQIDFYRYIFHDQSHQVFFEDRIWVSRPHSISLCFSLHLFIYLCPQFRHQIYTYTPISPFHC